MDFSQWATSNHGLIHVKINQNLHTLTDKFWSTYWALKTQISSFLKFITSISCSCSWLVEYICCRACSKSWFLSRRVFPSSAAKWRSVQKKKKKRRKKKESSKTRKHKFRDGLSARIQTAERIRQVCKRSLAPVPPTTTTHCPSPRNLRHALWPLSPTKFSWVLDLGQPCEAGLLWDY